MTASRWPLGPVVTRDQLGSTYQPLSTNDGQAVSVAPLVTHPDFLLKAYKVPATGPESARLDHLVQVPSTHPQYADILRTGTSWPVARVRDRFTDNVIGCMIPRALERYRRETRTAREGDTGNGVAIGASSCLEVDLLAVPDQRLGLLGIRTPSFDQRLAACRSLVRTAACFERLNLVYSGWSYSNAFWSPADADIFLIDVDGCGLRRIKNVYQPNWEDPLTPRSMSAETYVERYRVALLVARCLTARRAIPDVVAALSSPLLRASAPAALREILLDMLLLEKREQRPPVATLQAVVNGGPYVIFSDRRRMTMPDLIVQRTGAQRLPKLSGQHPATQRPAAHCPQAPIPVPLPPPVSRVGVPPPPGCPPVAAVGPPSRTSPSNMSSFPPRKEPNRAHANAIGLVVVLLAVFVFTGVAMR